MTTTHNPHSASMHLAPIWRLPVWKGSVAFCFTVWTILLSACGQKTADQAVAPPAEYEVRGVVRQIKEKSIGSTQLSIHHEAIPDFVGIQGDVVGMKSMTMPFTVAESVELQDISPGMKIAFQLTVDWSAPEPALITRIEVLPADTDLDLSGSG